MLDGKLDFIDATGKEATPIKYDRVSSFSEGMAAAKLDGKWSFIDKMDKEIVPLKYDYAKPFSEGMAPVRLNDKWGFISISTPTKAE